MVLVVVANKRACLWVIASDSDAVMRALDPRRKPHERDAHAAE